MIRPQKQKVILSNFNAAMIADHLYKTRDLVIGTEQSIDGIVCRNLYFEPEFVIMTESVWCEVRKDRNCERYLNMYNTKEPWQFCGLSIAVVRQTMSLEEEWFQIA